MQQPQTQTSSTPVELKAPPSTGPVLLDAKLLSLISGAGPNGGWSSTASGPNGGWF